MKIASQPRILAATMVLDAGSHRRALTAPSSATFKARAFMLMRSALLVAAMVPLSSNAAQEREVSWWTAEGASFNINGSEANYSAWWGFLRIGNRVCAIDYGSMLGQETAILFEGTSSDGNMKLSHVGEIRGTYSPEYGPQDPLNFYKGSTTLVSARYYRDEARMRIEVLIPLESAVFNSYSDELVRECEPRLTAKESNEKNKHSSAETALKGHSSRSDSAGR